MKKLLFLLLLPFLTGTVYHIPKGATYCSESHIVKLGAVKAINFIVTVDSTIIVDLGSTEANNAAQKLFGVSFGSNNHWNSWRLCYSIASVANKKIFLRYYAYNNGARLNTKFGANNQKVTLVKGFATFSGTVNFNYNENTINLSIPAYNIEQEFEFDFTRASKSCYQQFFYFEPKAPWIMTVNISQEYIYDYRP